MDSGVIGGDKAERPRLGAFQPPGEQHAQRLVRQPALERIDHHVGPLAAREGLDKQAARLRQDGLVLLDAQPVADLIGQGTPAGGISQHGPNLVCEIGGQRKFAAGIGRYLGVEAFGVR